MHPAERVGQAAGRAAGFEDLAERRRRMGDELLTEAADSAADWLAGAVPYADVGGESRAAYLAAYLREYAAVWRASAREV